MSERRAGTESGATAAVVSGDTLPPLIPSGHYDVRSQQGTIVSTFGRRKLLLNVEIVGGEYDGARIFWAATMPAPGRRPGISSKFFRAWLLVAGRRPCRGERLSPSMLEGKLLRARVETVTKDYRGYPLPPAGLYSVVRDLLERLA